jgi:hypothetical protein
MMKKTVLLACAAFVVGCVILAVGMVKIMPSERTVSVRGLAEREVDADLAVWKLTFSVGDNDLQILRRNVLHQTEIVAKFLEQHGLEKSDYTVMSPEVNDATMNTWSDGGRRTYTYIAKQSILIRSNKVAAVKEASDDTLSLAGSGVSVTSEYDSRVVYEFTRLNEIKPEMIALATQNARLAAEQFARDSGSKVGKIKSASQGLFSIDNAAAGLEEKKNVRVVTTVVYSLKD